MNRNEKIRYLFFRTLGNFFILLTIFGFIATFGPAAFYEVNYRLSNIVGVNYTLAEETTPGFGEILAKRRDTQGQVVVDDPSVGLFDTVMSGKKDHILVPPDTNFSVVIPKIGASERIQENVDPSNEKEFNEVLSHSIAHAKGSAFPGMNSNTYLFAHSAQSFWDVGRYNAVFYLLKEMKKGDEIYVFYENKRYNYIVDETKIVNADDTSYITSNLGQGETLTLQTCWPPGTSWKRFLVFAKPKQSPGSGS